MDSSRKYKLGLIGLFTIGLLFLLTRKGVDIEYYTQLFMSKLYNECTPLINSLVFAIGLSYWLELFDAEYIPFFTKVPTSQIPHLFESYWLTTLTLTCLVRLGNVSENYIAYGLLMSALLCISSVFYSYTHSKSFFELNQSNANLLRDLLKTFTDNLSNLSWFEFSALVTLVLTFWGCLAFIESAVSDADSLLLAFCFIVKTLLFLVGLFALILSMRSSFQYIVGLNPDFTTYTNSYDTFVKFFVIPSFLLIWPELLCWLIEVTFFVVGKPK